MKNILVKLSVNVLLFGLLILVSIIACLFGLISLYFAVFIQQPIMDGLFIGFCGIAFISVGLLGFYITNGLRLLFKS